MLKALIFDPAERSAQARRALLGCRLLSSPPAHLCVRRDAELLEGSGWSGGGVLFEYSKSVVGDYHHVRGGGWIPCQGEKEQGLSQ